MRNNKATESKFKVFCPEIQMLSAKDTLFDRKEDTKDKKVTYKNPSN